MSHSNSSKRITAAQARVHVNIHRLATETKLNQFILANSDCLQEEQSLTSLELIKGFSIFSFKQETYDEQESALFVNRYELTQVKLQQDSHNMASWTFDDYVAFDEKIIKTLAAQFKQQTLEEKRNYLKLFNKLPEKTKSYLQKFF